MPDASICCCIANKHEDERCLAWDVTSEILVDTTDLDSEEAVVEEQPVMIVGEETKVMPPKEEQLTKLSTPLSVSS